MQGQGKAGPFPQVETAARPGSPEAAELVLQRTMVIDHQRVEEGLPRGNSALLLHLRQRRVFMGTAGSLLLPQPDQPLAHGLVERKGNPDREGIDEESHYPVAVLKRTPAARAGRTEHHVLRSGKPAENHPPRPQHGGDQAESELGPGMEEGLGKVFAQPGFPLPDSAPAGSVARRKGSRGGEVMKPGPPEPLVGGYVPPSQPIDEAMVGYRKEPLGVGSPAERLQGFKQLLQHYRERGAIEDDVGERPDHPPMGLAGPEQRHPEQRRCGQVEPPGPVRN